MAKEISHTVRLAWSRGGAAISGSVTNVIDQTGKTAIENVQIIGTASEAIQFGDVTDPAYILFKNEDPTNFVSIGTTNPATTGNASIKLAPGHGAVVFTAQTAWYAIADTAPVDLLVLAIQR